MYFVEMYIYWHVRIIRELVDTLCRDDAIGVSVSSLHRVSTNSLLKALKCKTLGVSVMYIVKIGIIICTRQYTCTYADKCVNVRGSIRKFGKGTCCCVR